jgi:hypothetical protein
MSQAHIKRSDIPLTISCSHCQQKQVVHMQGRAGFRKMPHQSVKCVKCEEHFAVMIPDAIIGGPFLHKRANP